MKLRDAPPLFCVDDYRRAAKRALPPMALAYLEGGAEDERTLQRNLDAFRAWGLKQRVLTGVAEPDLRVDVAGATLSLPVALAPTGFTGFSHWHGELGAAQAADRCGTRAVISNAATYSLQEIADATTGRHWFQLYPWGNNRVHMREMLARAEAGGYEALFVTVDVPVLGGRETEQRHGMTLPPTLTPRRVLECTAKPRWAYQLARHKRFTLRNLVDDEGVGAALESVRRHQSYIYPEMTWADLEWVRSQWRGPLFVKGVMDPEDAEQAVGLGADGIVVSNHGGRQLESGVGTLDVLPQIARAVGDRTQVLLDGGVRRGTDVVKALALGARAVLVGRAYVYGLAVAGSAGAEAVLELLRTELRRSLQLMGCPSVAELDREWLLEIAAAAAHTEKT